MTILFDATKPVNRTRPFAPGLAGPDRLKERIPEADPAARAARALTLFNRVACRRARARLPHEREVLNRRLVRAHALLEAAELAAGLGSEWSPSLGFAVDETTPRPAALDWPYSPEVDDERWAITEPYHPEAEDSAWFALESDRRERQRRGRPAGLAPAGARNLDLPLGLIPRGVAEALASTWLVGHDA